MRLEIQEVQMNKTRSVWGSNRTPVVVRGKVVEVFRTASGLAPGSAVEIRYEHRARAGGSAETPDVPPSGQVVPAFLERRGTHYIPAARHLSFREPTEKQWKKYEMARVKAQEQALAAHSLRSPVPEVRPQVPEAVTSETLEETQPSVPREPSPATEVPSVPHLVSDDGSSPAMSTVSEVPAEAPAAAAEPAPRAEEATVSIETQEPAAEAALPVVEVNESTPLVQQTSAPPPPGPSVPTAAEAPTAEESITPMEVTASPQERAPAPATPVETPRPSPAMEGYSGIYLLIKKGESAHLEGRREEAVESYLLALERLRALKASQPDFQPFMVEYRMKDLQRRLKDLGVKEAREGAEKARP